MCIFAAGLFLVEVWFKRSDDLIYSAALVAFAPIMCFCSYGHFINDRSLVRILRILPLNAGTFAARLLTVTVGMQMLAFLVLGVGLMGYSGVDSGLRALASLFFAAALMSPLVAITLGFKGFAKYTLELACVAAGSYTGFLSFSIIFSHGSLLNISYAIILAVVLLLFIWWLIKGVLARSFKPY